MPKTKVKKPLMKPKPVERAPMKPKPAKYAETTKEVMKRTNRPRGR